MEVLIEALNILGYLLPYTQYQHWIERFKKESRPEAMYQEAQTFTLVIELVD